MSKYAFKKRTRTSVPFLLPSGSQWSPARRPVPRTVQRKEDEQQGAVAEHKGRTSVSSPVTVDAVAVTILIPVPSITVSITVSVSIPLPVFISIIIPIPVSVAVSSSTS